MDKEPAKEEKVEENELLENSAPEISASEHAEEVKMEFSADFDLEEDADEEFFEEEPEQSSPLLGLRAALDRLRGATSARKEAAAAKMEMQEIADQLAAARDTIDYQDEQIEMGQSLLSEALAAVEEVKDLLAEEQSRASALEAKAESLPELVAAKSQADLASLGLEIDKLPAAESEEGEIDLTNQEAVAREVSRLKEVGESGQATALRSAALRLRLGAN